MHELFAPDEMAMNVCRTCTGSSDYARSVYNFDDSDEDYPELKKFSIDHADNYPRQPGVDVQSYVLRVTLSEGTDEIVGETTVDVGFVQDGLPSFAHFSRESRSLAAGKRGDIYEYRRPLSA
jgi:hypothetical protein